MEACGSAHYWAREFRKLGHTVKLISPQFVKPYGKSNKNDAADAEAICEAVSRPNMRFVQVKEIDQQDIQGIHRIRERLVKSRTAIANEIRGLLQEYGIIIPKSIGALRKKFPDLLANPETGLTSLAREVFSKLSEEFLAIDERGSFFDKKIDSIHNAHPIARKLATITGVGPMRATAILASLSDPSSFRNARHFSAWLGLVPRQYSSGGKEVLLGISKRGDNYVGKLLIHGARTSLRWVEKKTDRTSLWAKKLKEKKGVNCASVALANKNARIIWALLRYERSYDPEFENAA